MGKIKKILENELTEGNQSTEVYPVTSIKAVYDENNERLDNIIDRKNNEIQKELEVEVARATNAESNLRETINNITEVNENATSANIVTIDNIPNTSSSNVQQALNELFKNALFAGIATPTTDPGTPDGPVFYFAAEPGTYSNFSGITINTDEVAIIVWNNGATWEKEVSGFVSSSYLSGEVAKINEDLANKVDANIVYTYNIYDISKRKHGKRLNVPSDHYALMASDPYTTTNEIPVEGGKIYYTIRPTTHGYNGSIVWLDSNKEWISGGNISDDKWNNVTFITAPENASYLVISYYDPDNVNTGVMVAQSDEKVPYKEYAYKYIQPDNLLSSEHIEEVKKTLMPLFDKKEDKQAENQYFNAGAGDLFHFSDTETIVGSLAPKRVQYIWFSNHNIDVKEGEVYYLLNVISKTTYCGFVILDENNIVIAKGGEYHAGLTRVEIPEGGSKLYWSTINKSYGWYLKLNTEDGWMLKKPEKKNIDISSSTDCVITNSFHSINGDNMLDVEMTTTSILTILVNAEEMFRVGIFIYIHPNDVKRIESLSYNSTEKKLDGMFNYNECHLFSKVISSSTSTRINIQVVMKDTKDTEPVHIHIGKKMLINMINKPVYLLNFDGMYQSSVNEGVYDYILNTLNLPITITGKVFEQYMEYIEKGQIERGVYGGEIGCTDETVTASTLDSNICKIEDSFYEKLGTMPTAFAARQWFLSTKVLRILKRHGFKITRCSYYCGQTIGSFGNCIMNDFVFTDQQNVNPTFKTEMGNLTHFAHCLADNPLDEDKNVTTSWSNGKLTIDRIYPDIQKGSVMTMTFDEFYDTLRNNNMFAYFT